MRALIVHEKKNANRLCYVFFDFSKRLNKRLTRARYSRVSYGSFWLIIVCAFGFRIPAIAPAKMNRKPFCSFQSLRVRNSFSLSIPNCSDRRRLSLPQYVPSVSRQGNFNREKNARKKLERIRRETWKNNPGNRGKPIKSDKPN